MFEHVAPLKFIVETAEERSPLPISQGASSAMLSATARRILENLERHSSPITSNDKIPLPNPRPPPPIMPLRARTTRYPSYMAAYHRFKANQRQQTLVSGACNDSTAQKSLFRYAESGDQPSGCGKVPAEKDPVVNSKDATRCPQVSLHSPTVPLCLSKDATSSSIVTEPKCVPLMVSSAPSPPAVAVSRPVNSDGLRRISSSPAFKFSSPISLKIQPSDRPSSTVSQDLHYTFSYPKSSLKIPAVSSSSFLPVLFSADGPTTSSVPIKRGESDACVCCQTKRSLTSSTTTANTATFNFGKPPPSLSSIDEASKKSANGVTLFVNNSNWECPTCLVSNKDSLNECPCCQTKKPAVSSGKKSPALAAPSFRFGEFPSSRSEKTPVASASGSSNANGHFSTSVASTWDCPTCLVSNKSTVDQCPCCQTRRPYLHGVASVNPQTTPVMFSFGSPSTSNDHPTSSSPPVIISNVKAAPFKFGVPAVSNSAASAAPNFSFSASIASTVSSVSSSVTSPSPIFNFSASTPVLNKFGTQSKSENPSDFTLGFKSANFTVVKPSTSLAYGLSPKPLDSTVNASAGSAPNGTLPTLPASNSLFTQIKFGSTSSASASTPNGIPSTSTSANPVAPAFIFGATQMKENVTPPIGLNSQPGSLFAKPPSAASTTANSQPTAPFKFGNPNQTAPFLFNSSSNGNDGVALFSTHP
ncbi:unnamed protein product [Schistocephalus solidus]|uniref:Nuclear pore complex protein Nup153 n=1 Tax=Schistocephalus solidus TaxID=70667 RepID=A0A183TKB4_SCHSO|nr:unnamed protein product [Schistocephalus solidus]